MSGPPQRPHYADYERVGQGPPDIPLSTAPPPAPSASHSQEFDDAEGDSELDQVPSQTMRPSMGTGGPVPVDEQFRRFRATTPIVTQLVFFINIAVFLAGFFVENMPSHTCISAYHILSKLEVYRVITSAFVHLSLMHIGFNMMSYAAVGPATERLMGSIPYFFTIIAMVITSGILYTGVGWAISKYYSCAAGFSGMLFALMAIHAELSPEKTVAMFGMKVKKRFTPWFSLIFTSVIMPQVSFIGHMCGILTGYVYCYGLLRISPDVTSWQRLERWTPLRPLTAHPTFVTAQDTHRHFHGTDDGVGSADDAGVGGDGSDSDGDIGRMELGQLPGHGGRPHPSLPSNTTPTTAAATTSTTFAMPGVVASPAPYANNNYHGLPGSGHMHNGVAKLVEMGFDRQVATSVLQETGGNIDHALHILMNE
eukprot:TRINITY_DN505_c0_g1_i10.p1 TRINITY_DN505_c0_g1~~TRINITY_DN505_c0_g1_i10.p1  ORF type:complete len:424 (+),score=61.65 TRINITY_DN505_c0_g1_i10:291-1562(+)